MAILWCLMVFVGPEKAFRALGLRPGEVQHFKMLILRPLIYLLMKLGKK